MPLLIAYGLFVLLTWFAYPLFNLLLRFNKFGWYALNRDQRAASNWFGACLALFVVGLLAELVWGFPLGLLIAGFAVGMALPLVTLYQCDIGWPRQMMTLFTAAMAILGTAALALVATQNGTANTGGKSREAAHVYVHADGRSPQEVRDNVQAYIEQGFRYIRIQMGVYGGQTDMIKPEGALAGAYFDPRAYTRNMLAMIEFVRTAVDPQIELLHDVHERLPTSDAVQFAKDVEPYKLFFLEDILAPEDLEWFANIRQQCSTPLAMGELFNNPREWQPLITNRLIDFIRMHISQMGGITPARNAAILADAHGIRTAWHGPGDVSPVGHAANLHLDVWAPNFGIQEWYRPTQLEYDMFPGTPEIRNGYLYPNDKPGLGIDIDEKLAANYPCQEIVEEWTQTRLPDGTAVRP
jgi:mannonate dehydratase